MVVIRYSIQRMVGKLKEISSTSEQTKVEEQRQRLVKRIETYHTKIDTILAGVDVGDAWIMLKQNIVRYYSELKPNIPTRNCIRSLRSQDLCK